MSLITTFIYYDYFVCYVTVYRDTGSEQPSGTIQIPDWEPGNKRSDVEFRIIAPADYRIQ